MDIILSTEKMMLPIFKFEACPKPLKVPAMHWCDSRRRAERSDLTADTCINAELSKSFKSEKLHTLAQPVHHCHQVRRQYYYRTKKIKLKKKKNPTWEFNEDRTLKSLYWLDDSLVSFAEVVETSYMNTMSSYLSWVTNMNPIWITHNIYFIVAIQSHIVQDHRPLHPFSIEFGLDAPNLYEILHWKNPGTTIQVFFAGFQSDFKR